MTYTGTSEGFNLDQIKAENPIEIIAAQYCADLKPNGKEFKGCCPIHDEKTPSFTVMPDKQKFHCFGCGSNGDVIDFIRLVKGVDLMEACNILGGKIGDKNNTPPPKKESKKMPQVDPYKGIVIISPVPEAAQKIKPGEKILNLHNPKKADDKLQGMTYCKPDMVFPYISQSGELLGYSARINMPNGGKFNPIITFCRLPDKRELFTYNVFNEPRPLYGAENLNLDLPVLILEGEKARDSAHRLLSDLFICIAWPGGTNAVNKANWQLLKGRDITIFPDNDIPGIYAVHGKIKDGEHIKGIAALLNDIGMASIEIIRVDKSKSKGWDIADAEAEGMKQTNIQNWIIDHAEMYNPDIQPEKTINDQVEIIKEYKSKTKNKTISTNSELPFQFLGYEVTPGLTQVFYVFSNRLQCVVYFIAKNDLIQKLANIAPLSFWTDGFGKGENNRLDQTKITEYMVSNCIEKGLFNLNKTIRGRGAWLDDERLIFHNGNVCYVDGVEVLPASVDSKYIYVKNTRLIKNIPAPATMDQANKLFNCIENFSWDSKLAPYFLTGWCVIAGVCGALSWRPHVWVSGVSGCGKSTLFDSIVNKMLDGIAIKREGQVTEAGIRQDIGSDAIPVILDEIEPDNKGTKAILFLARVASSGGIVSKGTPSGRSIDFTIRSAFIFGSINTALMEKADISRFTNIMLTEKNKKSEIEFKRIQRNTESIITTQYAESMLSRTLKNINVLMQNIDTFKAVLSIELNDPRQADQLSTLLGGCYLCFSDKPVTEAKVKKFIGRHIFDDYKPESGSNDERQLLDFILFSKARFQDESGSIIETRISELLIDAKGRDKYEVLDPVEKSQLDRNKKRATKELRSIGIIVENDYVLFSNTSNGIKEILKDTRWQANWKSPLKALPGAESFEKAKTFSMGIKARAVKVPWLTVTGNQA